jgi:hypothetical protein
MEPLSLAAAVLIVLSFVPPLLLLGIILYQSFRGGSAPWASLLSRIGRFSRSEARSGVFTDGPAQPLTTARPILPRDSGRPRRRQARTDHDPLRDMDPVSTGGSVGAGPYAYSTFIRPVRHLGRRSTQISQGFSRVPLLVYDRFGNCHTEHRLLCMN